MSNAEIDAFAAFAETLADAARAAILPHFRASGPVYDKAAGAGRFDPVTQADRGAEAAMRALIAERFPSHGIVGEEFGATPSQDGHEWVLDPIDGTRAFIAGVPSWGTLIALCKDGRPVVGIIDQAYLDERYRGRPGAASATIRGETRPLAVRPCPALTQAILATTDPNLFSPAEAGGFEHLRATARLTRFGLDCYAYAMLAAGFIDMVAESGLKRHDVAALTPVIEGAGGVVTDWRGGDAWNGGQILASGDPRPHAEALVSLRRCAR